MRYLLLIRPDISDLPDDWGPDPRLEEEMGALLEEMTKAGVLLDTAGLRPPEEGAVLRLAGGEVTVLDGPYTESKEFVGGYCLLQTRTRDEAVEWGIRFLRIHGDDWRMDLELRELDGQ
ncbi:transcriptional regulator [Microbacterium mangrovi]|uniref:Transcriptional regulator n=1 Tax=Microbacterium mangrovi TaxID=1348253 RepID=A0A0B2A476_9MICO|nr:YciI family protein [Microbacterium mangrovi]KHK96599.1 transcriptional regulator [Microbacterium mangrovi]